MLIRTYTYILREFNKYMAEHFVKYANSKVTSFRGESGQLFPHVSSIYATLS